MAKSFSADQIKATKKYKLLAKSKKNNVIVSMLTKAKTRGEISLGVNVSEHKSFNWWVDAYRPSIAVKEIVEELLNT